MALSAIDIPVLSIQHEPGFPVIKIFQGSCHTKRCFVMALDTILSKPVIMHVEVTGGTIPEFQIRKPLEIPAIPANYLMTLDTCHLTVFSPKGKFSIFMVKASNRTESFCVVTLRTFPG
jgi:hypothetical protein